MLVKLEVGVFFAFLSKAVPKYRCFSLAQCFLWWWGKPAENRSIAPAQCSVTHGDTTPQAKSKSLVRVDIKNVCPLGPAVELYYKCPSKKAQGHWPQIK